MPALPDAFSSLPDAAQVWIHPTAAPLDDTTRATLIEHLDAFVDDWTSHGQPVHGAAAVLYDRFVVLAGLRADGQVPSGCAIDEAARAIEAGAQALSVDWVPSLHILYRDANGTVAAVSRSTFQQRAEAGTITAHTTVFDPGVSTLGDLRGDAFERPAGSSWHAQAFSLPA